MQNARSVRKRGAVIVIAIVLTGSLAFAWNLFATRPLPQDSLNLGDGIGMHVPIEEIENATRVFYLPVKNGLDSPVTITKISVAEYVRSDSAHATNTAYFGAGSSEVQSSPMDVTKVRIVPEVSREFVGGLIQGNPVDSTGERADWLTEAIELDDFVLDAGKTAAIEIQVSIPNIYDAASFTGLWIDLQQERRSATIAVDSFGAIGSARFLDEHPDFPRANVPGIN